MWDLKSSPKEETEKLSFILRTLIFSGIYYLGKVDNPTNMGAYIPKKEHIIPLYDKIEDGSCNCIDCLLDDFQYSKALRKIYKYGISEKTDILDDVIYAHSLYRVTDFYSSYIAYTNLIQKANRMGRFEISFLAKYNLKRLGYLVRNSQIYLDKLSFEDADSLMKEAQAIDLDSELEKVKYFVDIEIYGFLKEIRNGVLIQALCNDIDENFRVAAETAKRIKDGGSGGRDFSELYSAVSQLNNFLKKDHIIGNGYTSVDLFFEKSLTTFLVGYSLKELELSKERMTFGIPHIKYFSTWLINLVIKRGNPKTLLRDLKIHDIGLIDIEDGKSFKIISGINNFFKSSFEKNKIFPGNHEQKIFTSNFDGNSYFSNLITKEFSNICVVLSYLNFEKNHLKIVFDNVIEFLEYVKLESKNEAFIYLRLLLHKRKEEFTEEVLLKLLEIVYNRYGFDRTYFKVLEIIKSKNERFKLEKVEIDKLDFAYRYLNITTLYNCLKKEQQKSYIAMFKAFLKTEYSDCHDYFEAINSNIISTKEIKEGFKNYVNEYLYRDLKEDAENVEHFNYRIFLLSILLYQGKIDLKGIEKEKIAFNYWKFLIEPAIFPQNKFKTNWLKYRTNDIMLKEFAKSEYIMDSLSIHLSQKMDEKLSEKYFKMRSYKATSKV